MAWGLSFNRKETEMHEMKRKRERYDGLRKRCEHARAKWKDCDDSWYFAFKHDGIEHRFSLDKVADARCQTRPRSRGEAEEWRDRIRDEIRTGNFQDRSRKAQREHAAIAPTQDRDTRPTFGFVCDEYLKRHVQIPTRRPRGRREMEIHVRTSRRAQIPASKDVTIRLDEKPICDITRADIEAIRVWRRQEQAADKSKRGAKNGEVGTNRLLSRLRHLFSWAVLEGYINDTPFKKGQVTAITLTGSVEGPRTRRLQPSMKLPDGSARDGEEARLLAMATTALLKALIVAALSTGARLGELLSMQWSQIRYDEHGLPAWIELSADKTKTGEMRAIPVASNLRAILEVRKLGLDGEPHRLTAYVFGNDCGEQVKSIRADWELTCERAGITDLHFHDLRREFASRLLESSADLHDVQLFLGHAAITTTSRYLRSTPTRLRGALDKLEAALSAVAQPSHIGAVEGAESPSSTPVETPVTH